MNDSLTHKQLVSLARVWLIQAKSCNPVFTEKGSARNDEFPDAIGWNKNGCIVVECKISTEDFNADKNKHFRSDDGGLGNQRFYLLERKLADKIKGMAPQKYVDHPILCGWGLVVFDENRGRAEQERFFSSYSFVSNVEAERNYLRSRILEIQRYGQ